MVLTGVSPDDAEAITALLAGDAELARQTATIPIPYTLETARDFLRSADPRCIFAIRNGGNLIGMIGMSEGHEPVEIGYWIGRVQWNRGYATEALRLLIEMARDRGIGRLAAEVFPGNDRSARVLERNGFQRVAEVERNLPQRGGLRRLMRFERDLAS